MPGAVTAGEDNGDAEYHKAPDDEIVVEYQQQIDKHGNGTFAEGRNQEVVKEAYRQHEKDHSEGALKLVLFVPPEEKKGAYKKETLGKTRGETK